jgi:hypothetical protein
MNDTERRNEMRIIDKTNGQVIGRVETNHNMTIDEAMNLIGVPWVEEGDNSGYKVGGVYYSPEDLEVDYDE